MSNQEKLITNTSYESLFSDLTKIRQDNHITSNSNNLDSNEVSKLTLSLALLLQKLDLVEKSLYGVEITSNGKGRNIRIPLVRISSQNQTVWKIVTDLKKIDKAIETLNDITFFLSENNSSDYPIPSKVIVLKENIETINKNHNFIDKLVNDNKLILFNLNFLKDMIKEKKVGDLNNILNKKGSLYII